MEVIPDSWNIFTIHHRKAKVDPKPPYQRGPTWSEQKQQLLIDTVLRNYDMPKLYLRRLLPPGEFEHEVADGQQRLRAIWGFMDGLFALGPASVDVPGFGDLSGRRFDELPEAARDRIGLFKVSIAEIRDATEEEIRDLFLRLQEGDSLNPPEKRNAMLGNMRDFIASLAETHAVFPLTHIAANRFAWHDLAAMATCLELAGGPTDIKAPSLRHMYEGQRDFDPNGPEASRVIRNLDYLAKVLRSGPHDMDIKWGFVDLYLAVSVLARDKDLEGLERDFLLMYTSFERDRRSVSEPAELLGPGREPGEEDLYKYIESFVREGGTRQHVAERHGVYLRRIARDIPRMGAAA